MGRPPGWTTAATGRPSMRSREGLPWGGGWIVSGSGLRSRADCRARTPRRRPACRRRWEPRWFRECGGMPNIPQVPLSGRYLSFADREEIAILRGLGHGGRQIARKINRSPSTVSRELRRNTATRGGRIKYKATSAQGMRTGGRDARRRPSWPPTTGCTTTCRSGSRAG
jgi:transposase, IS30 family